MTPEEFRRVLSQIASKVSSRTLNNDIQMYTSVGEYIATQVQKRTRLGYGVSTKGETQSKLSPLSPKYVSSRKGYPYFLTNKTTKNIFPNLTNKGFKYKIKTKLSQYTTPSKSNLTYTGQMLDSIRSYPSSNKVVIGFSNAEAQKKADFAHEGSSNRPKRPFMFLSDRELKNAAQIIRDTLKEKINNAFSKITK